MNIEQNITERKITEKRNRSKKKCVDKYGKKRKRKEKKEKKTNTSLNEKHFLFKVHNSPL